MDGEETDLVRNIALGDIFNLAGLPDLGSITYETPKRGSNNVAVEYEAKKTGEILVPELSLGRLGYTTDRNSISWSHIQVPEKKDIYMTMLKRIQSRKKTDCKVRIGKHEFACHLLILQCYSELFDGYVATNEVEISPDNCTAQAFEFVYGWMINDTELQNFLNRENVLDVYSAAKYLRIKDLVKQCWAFMDNKNIFNEGTAFLLYVEAKQKNMEEVRELMVPRIQDFFLMLVSSQDWLNMDVDDVKCFLRSNYIKVNCEMEVFMAAVRWLRHDPCQRNKFKLEVFSCIRFANIAPWQLVDIKRNPENPEFLELARDADLCKMIDDGQAFIIIKYWFGLKNNSFHHWNSDTGLKEPAPRNWTGRDQIYLTYQQFLIYLNWYRRNHLSRFDGVRFVV